MTEIIIFKDNCTKPYHVEVRINGKLASNHYNIARYDEAEAIAHSEYQSRDLHGTGWNLEFKDNTS